MIQQTIEATGTSAVPATALSRGVHFWRLVGRARSGVFGVAQSPTWEFVVGARSAPVDTSSGTTLDANGDGYADVLIGAPGSGGVYLYAGGPAGLNPTPTVLSDGRGRGGFGHAVASAGDVNGDGFADAVVGTEDSERVDVYLGGPAGLSTPPTSLNAPEVGVYFGASVAAAGDVNSDGYSDVVVGAYGSNTAYVYAGGAGGLNATPLTVTGPSGSGAFGYSVASAGDINGDGHADLIVGTFRSYSAYLYLGTTTGLSPSPVTLSDPRGALYFGYSVASAGDVNGDGYTDLAVGTFLSNTAEVFMGTAAGLSTAHTTLSGRSVEEAFGASVVGAGDLNGDGYADLAVGTSSSDTAYVYLGRATGVSTTATLVHGPGAGASFGDSVSSPGDVNRDGFSDLVVGAFISNTAYVFMGSTSGVSLISTTLVGPRDSRYFGFSIASLGAAHPPPLWRTVRL